MNSEAPTVAVALPESVTWTVPLPVAGAVSVQISARVPWAARAIRLVSGWPPNVTPVTVTDSTVETPTASTRPAPATGKSPIEMLPDVAVIDVVLTWATSAWARPVTVRSSATAPERA